MPYLRHSASVGGMAAKEECPRQLDHGRPRGVKHSHQRTLCCELETCDLFVWDPYLVFGRPTLVPSRGRPRGQQGGSS